VGERIDERSRDACLPGGRLQGRFREAEGVALVDLAPFLPAEYRRRVGQHDLANDRVLSEVEEGLAAGPHGRAGLLAFAAPAKTPAVTSISTAWSNASLLAKWW
jgi:hypothetical protein